MKAPFEASELVQTLHPDREQIRALPARAYTSPEVLEFEKAHFFAGGWVCAGRASDLQEPQSQREVSVLGTSLLVVRGKEGELVAFHNVCRHRGHQLVEPGTCRTRRSIHCPYHSWAYALDGSLLAAPTIAKGERLDYTAFSLQKVAVQERFGWLFVNLDGQAPSMEECFGAAYHIPANWAPERMTVAKTSTYDIAANWKLIIENYMECYHCTSIHPALCRVSQVGSEEGWTHDGTWLGGPMDLKPDAETMSLDGKSYGVTIPTLDDKQRRRVIYLAIAPNLLLSLHPDYIMTHRLDPIEPGRTIVECSWLFAPEATELPDFDPSYASDFWEITNGEDLGACASMQLGLASPGYVPGPFADSELEVFLAQRMMGKGYLDGRLTTPKMPREVVATPS